MPCYTQPKLYDTRLARRTAAASEILGVVVYIMAFSLQVGESLPHSHSVVKSAKCVLVMSKVVNIHCSGIDLLLTPLQIQHRIYAVHVPMEGRENNHG